jgi:hypothetical protein
MPMEFLIKRTDGEWFDLPSSRFKDVLRPSSMSSKPIKGWGDHRILVGDSEISFSDEDPGIQVVFETGKLSAEEAGRVVNEIAANITAATGQQSRVISL